jgi:hypothetical protein
MMEMQAGVKGEHHRRVDMREPTMFGTMVGSGVTARCPVHDCDRPIRSWRLWRRHPAQRAADVDVYFPVLQRFATLVPAQQWDPVDIAVFGAWGQWARTALHDWAHGDRDARTPLVTEAALVAWCTKADRLWEALAELDPAWCEHYADLGDPLPYDVAV